MFNFSRLFLTLFSTLIILSAATTAKPINKDCEVLRYISSREVKDKKLISIDTVVIQINNSNGEAQTHISIPFSGREKINSIEAWIEDVNGKCIRTLKKSEISESSAIGEADFYTDERAKTFQLKHNTYPYKICYTYKIIQEQFMQLANWRPVLDPEIATREAKLTITLPKNYPVKTYNRFISTKHTDSLETSIVYIYSSSYAGTLTSEVAALPLQHTTPLVICVPLNFRYGIPGSSESWKTFGDWFNELNKDLMELPETEKQTIDALLKNITDKKERIKVLYHYVQDRTRYINVSTGIGGFRAHPAAYVAQNKYGDCKALTNYMKALLAHANIKSYFTLIYRGEVPVGAIEELPTSQFNHVILTIPLDKDTIWLENTATISPFGYLSYDIQNRNALFIDEHNSRLINMPSLNSNRMQRILHINMDDAGKGAASATLRFSGYFFEQFNYLNYLYGKHQKDKIIKRYLSFSNYETETWTLNKAHRDTAIIALTAKGSLRKLLDPLGNGTDYYIVNVLPLEAGRFGKPADRKNPVQLQYTATTADSITYTIPEAYAIKSVPDHKLLSTPYGNYELRTIVKGNTVHIIKKLELFAAKYSVEDYISFYKFIASVNEEESKVIVVTRKQEQKK